VGYSAGVSVLGVAGIAVGYSASSSGTNSIAVGLLADAGGYQSIALGASSSAQGRNSIGIGINTTTPYEASIAIGNGVSTTRTNEIRLGGSQDVTIGGLLTAEKGATNLTLTGSNQLSGTLRITSRAAATLANGNNAGVPLGTNTMVDLSGATTIAYVHGFLAGVEDEVKEVRLAGAVTNFFANQSGVDATAENRIITGTGGDVWSTNNPTYLGLRYKGSRWEIKWIR